MFLDLINEDKKPLMKWASFILIVPYSLKYDSVKKIHYTTTTPKKFMAIIIVLQIMYFFYSLYPLILYQKTPVINSSKATLDGSVSTSIKQVVVYMVVVKELISIKVIWTSKALAAQICTELSRISYLTANLCGRFTNKKITCTIWILAAVFLFRSFWETAVMSNLNYGAVQFMALHSFPNHMVARFYAWYCPDLAVPVDFTFLEVMGGILVNISSLYAVIFDSFVDLWCLTVAILLYIIMDHLTSNLKNGNIKYDQDDEVLELIDRICRFVELMNDTINWLFGANVIIAMPYYASYIMDVVYTKTGYLFVANLLFYFALYFGIIVVAADANSKSRQISSWFQFRSSDPVIQSQSKYEPLRERTVIFLSQIESNAIAIRGGPFFTLTYSFLGNAISFIITYSVIILQNLNLNKMT